MTSSPGRSSRDQTCYRAHARPAPAAAEERGKMGRLGSVEKGIGALVTVAALLGLGARDAEA